MGIRTRFITIMVVLSAISIIAIGIASYKFSERSALNEARQKGDIIFTSMLAIQKNFMTSQRPLLLNIVEKDRFYPELMSGAVITRMTWDIFEKDKPDFKYKFKQAALDPRWPPNKADAAEEEIIKKFQTNPDMVSQDGVIERDGQTFYYRATPRKTQKNCLTCHSEPEFAPKDQVERYGAEAGYHWKEGDVSAAFIVYIPLSEALATARQNALWLLGIGTGGLLFALLGISIFLDRGVVAPILRLSQRTEEISLGKNLEQRVDVGKKDEIGVLAQAIERLRISLVKILRKNLSS